MRVSIDLVTGFKTSLKGNNVLLVMIDNFTRACELVPLPSKSAEVVAKAIHDNLICRYQSPLELSSDNGSEFINSVIKEMCDYWHINKVYILPYRPEANGITERLNRTIKEI